MQETMTSSSSSTDTIQVETPVDKEASTGIEELVEDLVLKYKNPLQASSESNAVSITSAVDDDLTLHYDLNDKTYYVDHNAAVNMPATYGSTYINSPWTTTIGTIGGASSGTSISYDDYVYKSMDNKPVSCTGLDGLEEVLFVRRENIISLSRKTETKFKLKRAFPFFYIEKATFTEIVYVHEKQGVPMKARVKESPTLVAKKFGIKYDKANELDLVEDDLSAN